MKRGRIALTLFLLFLFALAGCSDSDRPSDESVSSVEGQLSPWGDYSPIENRHIVLCRVIDQPKDGECELMESSAVTDENGKFAVSSVPAGTYFILYDSGLTDFDEALDRWGGEMLRFGDMEWLADLLGLDLRTEAVEFRVPEGISHSPHEGWLTQYCTLTLSVGNSPFIIAHDMVEAQEERELHCLIVDVTPGEAVSIDVQAAYYGKP
ncbi:MAG TPA: hypothetical protein VFI27_22205 [candidate division Zixibacteria bacterium]|nr:hypothetical protein [candidate division Zixibacteria bacterium]